MLENHVSAAMLCVEGPCCTHVSLAAASAACGVAASVLTNTHPSVTLVCPHTFLLPLTQPPYAAVLHTQSLLHLSAAG
jgi:hypothetical protein